MKTSDARKLMAIVDRVAAERSKRNRTSRPPRPTAPTSLPADGQMVSGSPAIVDRFFVQNGGVFSDNEFPSGNQSRFQDAPGVGSNGEVVEGIVHSSGPNLGTIPAEKLVANNYRGQLGGRT